jgi:hypothetical protein
MSSSTLAMSSIRRRRLDAMKRSWMRLAATVTPGRIL